VTRIEMKIWDADRGCFIATGEAKDVDIDTLEREAERPPASGDRFLKGPFPGLGSPRLPPCRAKRC